MYLDRKALVSVGVGNLVDFSQDPNVVDPAAPAKELPFVHKADGTPASVDEIAGEWQLLKDDPGLAEAGHLACEPLTKLMLTEPDIDALVGRKLDQFESVLRRTPAFSDLDNWPADAQLGLIAMAWALGPAFGPGWPNFSAACEAKDWRGAAAEAFSSDFAPRRHEAHLKLFENAAVSAETGLDLATLLYQPPPPVLRSGSSGRWVTKLQESLRDAGVSVAVTGQFDAETDAAVRGFQAQAGLDPDGVVGPRTWAALGVS
jgi:hypothetical protein